MNCGYASLFVAAKEKNLLVQRKIKFCDREKSYGVNAFFLAWIYEILFSLLLLSHDSRGGKEQAKTGGRERHLGGI
jgi:hypothetical protein